MFNIFLKYIHSVFRKVINTYFTYLKIYDMSLKIVSCISKKINMYTNKFTYFFKKLHHVFIIFLTYI